MKKLFPLLLILLIGCINDNTIKYNFDDGVVTVTDVELYKGEMTASKRLEKTFGDKKYLVYTTNRFYIQTRRHIIIHSKQI